MVKYDFESVIPGLTRNPVFFWDSRFRGNNGYMFLVMNLLVDRRI